MLKRPLLALGIAAGPVGLSFGIRTAVAHAATTGTTAPSSARVPSS
jgi:hypothetical protein